MALRPGDPGRHRFTNDEEAVNVICNLLNSEQEWNSEMVVQIARVIWNANREVSRLELRGRGRQ